MKRLPFHLHRILLLATLTAVPFFLQPDLVRGEEVSPRDLPEDLRGMAIQDRYIPAGTFARAGVVQALQGTLIVVHRATGQAFAAHQGDPVHENDEMVTLVDSRCRVRLLTDDVVSMGPETRFSVDEFLDQPDRGGKSSVFSMVKGKAVFYALRLFRYKETRFKVKTPTAVVGVRGTQFGVHVFPLDGTQANGHGVRVADREPGFGTYLAQAAGGGPPSSGTIVACGDGQLDLTDPATGQPITRVSPNEDFNTATGQKTFDPQNRTLNGLVADTSVQENGDGQGSGSDDGGGTPGGQGTDGDGPTTGDDSTAGAPTDLSDLTTNVTTQQTGDQTATEGEGTQEDYPSRHFGYFNGILTASAGTGGYYFTMSLADLDAAGTAEGRREGVDVGDMHYDGAGAPGIKKITGLTHNGNTVDSGLPATVEYWGYGHDSFMVWGCWRQPYAMTDTGSGIEHYFDYRGYYFVGDHTTDAQMAALHSSLGLVTYSGQAWGKHYQQPAGTDMFGTFTAQVNFSSPAVTDFDMSVSGGGHSASIANATGSFSGNSSQFVIDTGSGSWHVDGASAMYKDARGGLYGNEAQKMGVIWVMKESSGSPNNAWGMCVGGR